MPDNDILKEQQRRNKELLEIKKIEQQGGDLPNNIEHTVLKTKKEKAAHFWDYYKWYVIVGAILTAAFIFLVAQCVNKVEFDSVILFNSTEFVYEEAANEIEALITPLVTDTNGDGEIHLSVINCTRGDESGDAEYNTAQANTFQAQVFDGTARIFIVNKEIFEQFNEGDMMLWSDYFNLPEFEGKAISIKDTAFAEILAPYKDEYYLCYRISDSYDTADAKLFTDILDMK